MSGLKQGWTDFKVEVVILIFPQKNQTWDWQNLSILRCIKKFGTKCENCIFPL